MNSLEQQAHEIVSQMSEEQKAKLAVGKNYWQSESLEEFSLPGLFFSDGPHGLRKQIGEADYTGLHPSLPAVCYPSASLSACSFDPALMKEMGKALGEECLEQGVDVLLGPGINHKRTPWCGRSFEYFSEDPVLTSRLAAAWIEGVQSQNVQTALKHYACNSQENYRMTTDSIIDERAFRELYTASFERILCKVQPSFIMTSYNKINGIYASEHQPLMSLARSFGFDGPFITDWGSLNQPQASFEAGTDLEMPGLSKGSEEVVLHAVSQKRRDEIAYRLVYAMLKAKQKQPLALDENRMQKHLDLSEKIAEESMVLLKNEDQILPVSSSASIAIIGDLAKNSRIQGAGSSKVQPAAQISLFQALEQEGAQFVYAQGVRRDGSTTPQLLEEARKTAANQDAVILVLGLPEIYESEGYDRTSLALPQGHLDLFEAIWQVNPNIIVVLQTGSVVELPFASRTKAILLSYLSGGMGQLAAARILLGKVNPSGHLAETWVKSMQDVPVIPEDKNVFYRESMYSGYRYYNTYHIEPAFPFGYGLTYTTFVLSDIHIENLEEKVQITAAIQNTGSRPGAQILQAYIHARTGGIHRPEQELKDFQKVFLQPGEKKELTLTLKQEDFAYFDVKSHQWQVEQGEYEIQLGFSSIEILHRAAVYRNGCKPDQSQRQYFDGRNPREISSAEYESVLTRFVQPEGYETEPFDQNVTIEDLRHVSKFLNFLFERIISWVLKKEKDESSRKILAVTINQMPLRLIGMYGFSKKQIEGVVDLLNHHYMQGIKKLLGKTKQNSQSFPGN